MVDRDDLLDGGAEHVARTVRALKKQSCGRTSSSRRSSAISAGMRDVDAVGRRGRPDVFAHNVEVVASLQRTVRDARSSYEQSLARALARAKKVSSGTYDLTKSRSWWASERPSTRCSSAMADLREAGRRCVDARAVPAADAEAPRGRALRAPRRVRDAFARAGDAMGFLYTASGPLVRSSYRASEAFLKGILRNEEPSAAAARAEHFVDRGESSEKNSGKKSLPVLR
jgi:lipoic acid synthetase